MSPVPGDSRQDPHNPNADDLSLAAMETNIIIAAGSSSDSAGEEEEDGYQGYQMLPQDAGFVNDEGSDGDDEDFMAVDSAGAVGGGNSNEADQDLKNSRVDGESSNSSAPPYVNVPNIENLETLERKSLWSQSRLHPQEPMDEDHLNKIKAAMSSFSLPGCHIPAWARVVSEDDWKSQLLGRLQGQVPLINSSSNNTNSNSDMESSVDGTLGDALQADPPNKRARCSRESEDEDESSSRVSSEEAETFSKTTIDEKEGNGMEER